MNKELKNKWIEALRSGKYNQTRETLRNKFGFCCLGVLCDIYDNTKWTGKEEYDGYLGLPPQHVTEGLDEDFIVTLAKMNDSGSSFNEIAVYIELYERAKNLLIEQDEYIASRHKKRLLNLINFMQAYPNKTYTLRRMPDWTGRSYKKRTCFKIGYVSNKYQLWVEAT